VSTPIRETFAVTGASGFLGAALCRTLRAGGHRVRALVRDPARLPADLAGLDVFRCDLPDGVEADALEGGVGALVHCAFEMRFRDAERARTVNVDGSARIFDEARRKGVGRILFVTSMSAHDGAISVYGRCKREVEALLDPARDAILRPGHIVGEGGVFWRQAASIARLPFIPLFYGGRQEIQVLALADACEAVRRMLERGITGRLTVAHPQTLTLREFYSAIAVAVNKPPRFLRLPGGLTWALLRVAERAGVRLPLSSDNLLGLKQLRVFDVEQSLARLGLSPRALEVALSEIDWNQL